MMGIQPETEAVRDIAHTGGRNDGLYNFISRVLTWPEPGSPGFVNMHWKAKGSEGFYWDGQPMVSPDEFVGLASWAVGRPNFITDIYFCLSLQQRVGKSSRGKPTAARSAEAAMSLKAIWLDIDVKTPPKGYATFEEAVRSMADFTKAANLPWPSALVASGGGLHVYWISDKPLTVDEWRPYAEALKASAIKHGLRCDPGLTTDCARILRVPNTFNYKTDPPQPVRLIELGTDYDFSTTLRHIAIDPATVTAGALDLSLFAGKKPAAAFAHLNLKDNLSAGVGHNDIPLNPRSIIMGCPFFHDAFKTHGKDHTQPLWNLTILAATFLEKGKVLAHELGNWHPGYTAESTDTMYARKMKERTSKGLGWPSCKAIESEGCKFCAGCSHYGKIKSPLNLHKVQQTPAVQASFVDPYSEFVGPQFPVDVLSPTVANFVDAEYRAMGADPSGLAMAALAAIAGAIHAETRIRAGEGWWERPVVWVALIGAPSTMKSPTITKAVKPLSTIDHHRARLWGQEYAKWQSNQK